MVSRFVLLSVIPSMILCCHLITAFHHTVTAVAAARVLTGRSKYCHNNNKLHCNSPNSGSKNEIDVDTASNSDRMVDMVDMIVTAVNNGNTDELKRRGLSVTTKSARDALDDKLSDPDIRESVLGSMDEEELEIVRLMQQMQENNGVTVSSTSSSIGSDDSLIDELRVEAMVAMSSHTYDGIKTLLDVPESDDSFNSLSIDPMSSIAASGAATADNEAVFAELLKASIEASENSAEGVSDEVVSSTLNAINTGNLDDLDLSAVLGDALKSLTDTLNIDIKSELSTSQSKQQLQAIIANGMAELSINMKQLDDESLLLSNKLEILQQELMDETRVFDEKKKEELESLLEQQSLYNKDFYESVKSVSEKTNKLENIITSMETDGDAITQIALFPLKSNGKKAAFIIGLSLLFKVPYDTSMMFAVRSIDANELFTLFVQSSLCIALFHYYGLVQALMRKQTLPSSP